MQAARLSGKTALVTGASRGIGAAIARRLAADGAKVVVNYSRSAGPAEEVVGQIRKAGGEATLVRADVSNPEQIKPLFDAARKAYGRVDILVNNAGIFDLRPVEQADVAHYTKLFDVNVRGPLLATAEFVRQAGPDGGRVINISSGVVRGIFPSASVYSATKAALEALTRVHAAELGPRKITVNAVAPGTTETEMLREGMAEEMKQYMIKNTALGRLGTPEDIAAVVAFLASDDGRWITGQSIDANGGLRL
jgi:3-oxoacyl-[acyl-carrier protein] reductase